jgi:hypothetical protein
MKYKTAARLALKLLGAYLIASGIPALVNMGIWLLSMRWSPSMSAGWWYVGSFIGSVVQILIGLYLFFGGRWIVDYVIPSNRPYCHECAYELTGLPPEGVCPECGTPYRYGRTADTRERA